MRAGICVCSAEGACIHDVFMYSPESLHEQMYHLSLEAHS